MIKNKKTVDPKDDSSTKVVQLETAMGAAIECFEGATAIVVSLLSVTVSTRYAIQAFGTK
eukprot:scaffold111041_cov65-Attheya_sp.AAC.4